MNKRLNDLLQEIADWNQSDIDGFDDISPSMDMLEARAEVIKEIQKLVSELQN